MYSSGSQHTYVQVYRMHKLVGYIRNRREENIPSLPVLVVLGDCFALHSVGGSKTHTLKTVTRN